MVSPGGAASSQRKGGVLARVRTLCYPADVLSRGVRPRPVLGIEVNGSPTRGADVMLDSDAYGTVVAQLLVLESEGL